MDPHRLGEERSLAYHKVIGERLTDDPAILRRARARVDDWLEADPERFYARAWRRILLADMDAIRGFLEDRGELATELRQSSPFAGALTPRERWKIWAEVRERLLA